MNWFLLIFITIFIIYCSNYYYSRELFLDKYYDSNTTIIDAIKNLGYKVKTKDDGLEIIGEDKVVRLYTPARSNKLISGLNSEDSKRLCRNKYETNKVLGSYGFPVPEYQIVKLGKLNKISLIDYPCVLKPIQGSGGRDVYSSINNDSDLWKAIDKLNLKYREVLNESFTPGNDYRILVYGEEILSIVERKCPYVVGNGKDSILELVEKNNRLHVYNTKIDEGLLKKKGLTRESILPIGESILVSNTCNFQNGGVPIKIKKSRVHPDNLEIFSKINGLLGTSIIGIDFKIDTLANSYRHSRGTIIEINSSPSLRVHFHASGKKNYRLVEKIVGKILSSII